MNDYQYLPRPKKVSRLKQCNKANKIARRELALRMKRALSP